eukprot:TRINITY_DN9984_c0_g1_i1.p1 TRINITY_DN9984_c0_g1~~TRINITY_DN9984_c0_g1_i1.p1  ORF type:complete len:231 (-),score=51.43 TRINITY_DN9984_c0_g1_i1:14-628(-)
MSKKRGMSLEEKRETIRQLYLDENSVFTLKEIEKMATKKGVVSQSVKDVNQSLVDDGMVLVDKIGIGNFYWLFASQQFNKLDQQLKGLQEKQDAAEKAIDENEKRLVALEGDREGGDERKELLQKLSQLEALAASQARQLADMAELDPDTLKAMLRDSETCVTATNRWTDAITETRSYLVSNLNVGESDLNKRYRIAEDLDYIE